MFKKFLVSLLCLFTFACSGGGGGSDEGYVHGVEEYIPCGDPDYNVVQNLGYYWGNSPWYGNFIDEFVDHTTFTQFVAVYANPYIYQEFDQAIEGGQDLVLSLTGIFHMQVCTTYVDCEEYWNGIATALAPYQDHILAVYLFDEPYLWGISLHQQQWAVDLVKATFPEAETWATFAYSYISKGMEIADYDKVSITPAYGNFTAADMEYYMDIVQSSLEPHQGFFITADGFSFNNLSEEDQEMKAQTVEDYYTLAACNEVNSIMGFLWDGVTAGGYGVRDLPIVEEVFREIGQEILY